MITAKDIHRKKFEKVKFGYSPEEVDAFLSQIEADLRLMEQELTDANDKVQLLADKVREYKETEDDLKNALIGAQKQAREVIEAANAKAEQIEEQAKAQVDSVQAQARAEQEEQLQAISAQLAQENAVLVATQRQVASFKKALFDMYKAHLEQISKLPETAEELVIETETATETAVTAESPTEPETAPAEPEAAPAETVSAEAAPEEQPADPFATEESPKKKKGGRDDMESRYGDLQFGSRRDDKRKRS